MIYLNHSFLYFYYSPIKYNTDYRYHHKFLNTISFIFLVIYFLVLCKFKSRFF